MCFQLGDDASYFLDSQYEPHLEPDNEYTESVKLEAIHLKLVGPYASELTDKL